MTKSKKIKKNNGKNRCVFFDFLLIEFQCQVSHTHTHTRKHCLNDKKKPTQQQNDDDDDDCLLKLSKLSEQKKRIEQLSLWNVNKCLK